MNFLLLKHLYMNLFTFEKLFSPLQLQDYDPYEENPGTAPFSEPETQIMRKLAISFDPHIWVNVHSGMEVDYSPYSLKLIFVPLQSHWSKYSFYY